MEPLSFGLVGAGPWARHWHAPLLAEGPETRLDFVWARRADAARELAARHGAIAVDSYEELVHRSQAVAFTVPPNIQAELAPIAARAGKALLLEKPAGFTAQQARGLADVINETGVPHMLMLTNRFNALVDNFIAESQAVKPYGAVAVMVAGAILPGAEFSTPWRWEGEAGVLADNGPHTIDIMEQALGPITGIAVHGHRMRWNAVTLSHESGAVSTINLSLTVDVPEFVFRFETYGAGGRAYLDTYFADGPRDESAVRIRREFAEAVRSGVPHRLDINRGVYLQEWIDAGHRSLDNGGSVETVAG